MCRSGDVLFASLDAQRQEISFIATANIPTGGAILLARPDGPRGEGVEPRFGAAGHLRWTAPKDGLEAGTVVTLSRGRPAPGADRPGQMKADHGQVEETGQFCLSGVGDGIYAVEGTIEGDCIAVSRVIAYVAPGGPAARLGTGALILPPSTDYFTYDVINRPDIFDTRHDFMAALVDAGNFITHRNGRAAA